jgi:RIO-like serine/threonine protein kinase
VHGEIVAQGILHCDISLNNIMVYYECIPGGIVTRGLLIDYDYATMITKGSDRVGGRQDLTVSIFHLCYFTDLETDMTIFRVL